MSTDEPRQILISFCNVNSPDGVVLGSIDPELTSFRPLMTRRMIPGCAGITGILLRDDYILAVSQRPAPSDLVVISRRDLTVAAIYPIAQSADVHSIMLAGPDLYIASTGTDEVLSLRLGREATSTVRWRPVADEPREDIHHLNAFCGFEGQSVVSGFGKKEGERWTSAGNGAIWSLDTGEALVEGIDQPHSLLNVNGRLAYCESRRQSVAYAGGKSSDSLGGYTRGLCQYGYALFAGTSKGRKVSRSTGVLNRLGDPGAVAGACSISRLSLDLDVQHSIDLSEHSDEIYDLLPY